MRNGNYDLEERTFIFAKNCRLLVKQIKLTLINVEDCKQLIRSSGSIGANYIEANEALSKKDFRYRIKICRKESKESKYWLDLLFESNRNLQNEITSLSVEAEELKLIFSAILGNTK
ncbi:MAG: four helix bundle protein [Balneolaceae bacterium]|jgi:four helix bundle protein|nr:MAG: four helix bundle protein [Balneolaceae bacterium]